jgi:HEAT repeat protein
MDVFRPNLQGQDEDEGLLPRDPRLQPTPDYGSVGPDSDLAPIAVRGRSDSCAQPVPSLRGLPMAAMVAGVGLALAVSSAGGTGAVWGKFSNSFSLRKDSGVSSVPSSDARDLDGQKPQEQAEILLERAMARSDGATGQIESRVEGWRGKLVWDAHLGELTTVALNSSDRNVRDSAIDVQLAAYGLPKNEASVEALIRQANSSDHAQRIWAFWGLGLLANRGIETDRVVQVLRAHLRESDRGSDKAFSSQPTAENSAEDARRWAVEALAVVGTTPTVALLLEVMHDDPSGRVRERAACGLAESGMLSREQRMIAVPQLIQYSDDPALDAQTRAWAFQALGDITRQRLPNDSAAWRNWYQNHNRNH